MKTTMKQLAAGTFIAVLLMVGNVNAKNFKAANCEIAETTLQMENWMTNETIWNTNSINNAELTLETEPSMELENWMTNAETWNKDYNNDSELTVEPWMINGNFWK